MREVAIEKRVIESIEKSGDLEKLKVHIDRFTRSNSCLILFSYPESKESLDELLKKVKNAIEEGGLDVKVGERLIEEVYGKIRKSSRSRSVQEVKCRSIKGGWIFPLIHGGAIYGYLYLVIPSGNLPGELVSFINDYLSLSLEKALKEVELIKIHSSLKPRAIALSTVHTVHRLISSTLYMEELLPRLARLCLQVTRAKVCIIYMRRGAYLKPEAVASVNSKPRPRKIKVGEGGIGRALDQGSIVMGSKVLWVPLIEEEVIGAICLREKQSGKPFDVNDKEILSVLAEQAIIAIKNAELYETQGKVLLESLKSLSKALDVKSPKTYTHPMSFLDLVMTIADEYGLSAKEKENLRYATLILDTGKLAVPEHILKKESGLTEEEFRSIKEHPLKGAEIVKSIKALRPIVPIILYHHERYDGKGYPRGLKGEKIPIGARIIALADAFEAMICQRPYKKRLSFEEAVEEIKRQRGKQFDPKVVDAFLRAVKKGKIQRIACRIIRETEGKK